jgi:hypothetical protein
VIYAVDVIDDKLAQPNLSAEERYRIVHESGWSSHKFMFEVPLLLTLALVRISTRLLGCWNSNVSADVLRRAPVRFCALAQIYKG